MRTIKTFILLSSLILMAGCWTLSLEPVYTEKDVVFDGQLVGAWGDTTKSQEETWIFEQVDNKTYHLVTREKGKPDGLFEAHLVRLGSLLLLDIYPDEPGQYNEFYFSHLVPAHSVLKVTFNGKRMTLAPLNNDWLGEGLKNKTINIPHINKDNVIILTAPTEELQQFILAHADNVFEDDPFVLFHKNW